MAWSNSRQTKSGERRYDVGYRGPDGKVRHETFKKAKDAERFKRTVETDIVRGQWIDPNAGMVSLRTYSTSWLAAKPTISPKTRDLYEGQLRKHILPTMGDIPLNRCSPNMIREWRAALFNKPGMSPNNVAKCYRLLHAVLATAAQDELILRNPCAIKDAGKEEYDERPVATIPQVFALADFVATERRALVLLAALSGLRMSELLALKRRHIDLLHKRIVVEEATVELARGELVTKKPKSKAGLRAFHLDPVLATAVEAHLDEHTALSTDAYLFTGTKGGQLRRGVWQKEWTTARKALGLQGLHFHDLRHTHGTLTAQSGATLKETMRRLGHSTIDAAMIYQHATDERDREIAEAMGRRIVADLQAEESDTYPAEVG